MTRPSVAHGGFLIPNAGDVSDPILAEPDRIDFNTVAGGRWGVLVGCGVTGRGGTGLTVAAGTAMVNGKFTVIKEQKNLDVTVPTGASKFDLVVVDDGGNVYLHKGIEAADPVFPDPAVNETLLAAVYCKSGIANVSDYIIDKRVMLAPALITQINANEDLVRNYKGLPASPDDPLQDFFTIHGDGSITWLNDTVLSRYGVATLQVANHLRAIGNIVAGLDLSAANVVAAENVTALNLRRTTSMPPISTARVGDIWQNPANDVGSAYIARQEIDGSGLFWDEMVTFGNVMPTGMICYSLESPTRMARAGWLALDGKTTVHEAEYPNLFNVAALKDFINTGVAPNRSMALPDMTRRFPLVDFNSPGKYGPKDGANNRANNAIYLTTAQLPPHAHGPVATGDAGGFTPAGKVETSGSKHGHTMADDTHSHDYTDPGHPHSVAVANLVGATLAAGAPVGTTAVLTPNAAGRSRVNIDEAYVKITIKNDAHHHNTTNGDHDHAFQANPIAAHHHAITEKAVGENAAIDITPNYLSMYCYVRS